MMGIWDARRSINDRQFCRLQLFWRRCVQLALGNCCNLRVWCMSYVDYPHGNRDTGISTIESGHDDVTSRILHKTSRFMFSFRVVYDLGLNRVAEIVVLAVQFPFIAARDHAIPKVGRSFDRVAAAIIFGTRSQKTSLIWHHRRVAEEIMTGAMWTQNDVTLPKK